MYIMLLGPLISMDSGFLTEAKLLGLIRIIKWFQHEISLRLSLNRQADE